MELPTLPAREKRPVAVTVRLSKTAVGRLRSLAKAHNMSQADVIEHLLAHASDAAQKATKKRS